MKFISVIIICLSLVGCSSSTQDSIAFDQNLKRFASANVSRMNNTLFVGRSFPRGRIIRLNNAQAREFQSILSHAKFNANDRSSSSSASSNLSYLEVAGRTWYFKAPFTPYGFSLPSDKRREMQSILRNKFGVR